MDRSLVLKAKALARGTRRLPRLDSIDVMADDMIDAELAEVADDVADDVTDDVIDADFVDVPAPTALAVALPPQVSPGRMRRVTDAYTASPIANRPVIAIG